MSSVRELRERYRRDHWGQRGPRDGAELVECADPRIALVELGELVAVTYRSEKGRDGLSDYHHEFEGRLPRLAYNAGGLVIARAGSLYTVTHRGIEG